MTRLYGINGTDGRGVGFSETLNSGEADANAPERSADQVSIEINLWRDPDKSGRLVEIATW